MRFKRIEIVLNILFWVLVTWFTISKARIVDTVEIINGKTQITYIRSYERTLVFFFGQLFFITFFYFELYLIKRLKKPKAIRGFVLKSLALLIVTPVLYIILVKGIIFPNNEASENLSGFVSTILYYMALAVFYGFTKKWIKQEQEKKELELVKKQAELSLLRQQLQPHFLFNTMNNLLAMVDQRDHPKLAQGIDKLSNLLRYVVYDMQQKSVTIAQEIAFINNFAELHLLRFEDEEVDFTLNINGEFDQQHIEPGILLCYVENAFKHSVQPEEHAFIFITIDISKKDTIIFNIENSLPKIPFKNDNGGFGLTSNQERLDLAYPNTHAIVFKKEKNYKVQLTIHTDD